MIASRFRSVGWVVAGTAAMLGCYLVTQHVAGERQKLAQVEHRLLVAKRDVRQLQTEIETRARLGQLERWNSEVLALTAPKPSQFVQGEVQLASYTQPKAPAPVAAAVPSQVAAVSYQPAAQAAHLVPATYVQPAGTSGMQRIALLDESFADASSSTDKKTHN